MKFKNFKIVIISFKVFFFLIINFIILIFNIFLTYFNFKNEKIPLFKNVDLFFINISKNLFEKFSFYLNSKFYKNDLTKIKLFDEKIKQKKLINIYFVDSLNNYYKNILIKDITKLLENRYIFNITSVNPDYLIFDIFKCEHLNLKYNKSIKIGIYTENQFPDFSEADYAISYHNINYLDRYFRNKRKYMNNFKRKLFETIRKKALKKKMRKKFCAAVISNINSSDGFRIKFIKELSKYKTVDMGGIYKNNVGGIVRNKINFLSSYKFSIAMENSEGQGYISEKIYDSFLAGTIPIYYGGYMIDEFINPKSYILIKNEKDMIKKIEYYNPNIINISLFSRYIQKNPFLLFNENYFGI